jgi:TMEM175 potassium channel family protein
VALRPRIVPRPRRARDEEPPSRPVRLSDTQRTESFSDGVFAIAITLLVLNLSTPPHGPGHLLDALLRQWPAYMAYGTSFLFIGVIWFNHHQVFTRIRYVDRGLHVGNLAILVTTAVLPFPTEVVAGAVQEGNVADERVAVAFYALAAALMCASWLLFFLHLHGHPDLVRQNVDAGAYFRWESFRATVGVVLYLAAAVVGWTIRPMAALPVFAFLPAFFWSTSEGIVDIPGLLRRRRAER